MGYNLNTPADNAINGNGYIFISYQHDQFAFASGLANDILNNGIQVWMDKLDSGIKPGNDWPQTIQDAIDSCKGIIIVMTLEYLNSNICRNELTRAASRSEISIFPIIVTQLPKNDWPLEIQGKQAIFFSNADNYYTNVSILVKSIQSVFSGLLQTDEEIIYLNTLIAEINVKMGVLEYTNLKIEERKSKNGGLPSALDEWGFSYLKKRKEPVRGDKMKEVDEKIPLKNIDEAIGKFRQFVLIGDPGSGKTTTLRKLVFDAAKKRLANKSACPIPLLASLNEWRDNQELEDFITANCKYNANPLLLLKKGSAFLYLDGLNEMGSQSPSKAMELAEWLQKYHAHTIITCRQEDYTGNLKLNNTTVVVINELDEKKIIAFSRNYLGEKADGFLAQLLLNENRHDDNYGSGRYLSQSGNTLRSLAQNPYMLSALIFFYRENNIESLPKSSGLIFKSLIASLWEREKERKTVGWVIYDKMIPCFSKLAFAIIDEGLPLDVPLLYAEKFVSAELLKVADSASLIDIHDGKLRFYHQLLLESFASRELLKVGVLKKLVTPAFYQDAYNTGRIAGKWDQVIIALTGIEDDVDRIIFDIQRKDVFLAAECISKGAVLRDEVIHKKLVQKLRRKLFMVNLIDLSNWSYLVLIYVLINVFLVFFFNNLYLEIAVLAVALFLVFGDVKKTSNRPVRTDILMALVKLGGEDSYYILSKMLKSRNDFAKFDAENVIRLIKDKEVMLDIKMALKSSNKRLRESAQDITRQMNKGYRG